MQTILAILTIFFLQFTDKVGSERVCLSELAMQMREQRGIVIDSMDYEVSPIYLDSVRAMGARILHTSRWLNGATIELPMDAILPVEQCDFIDTISNGEIILSLFLLLYYFRIYTYISRNLN